MLLDQYKQSERTFLVLVLVLVQNSKSCVNWVQRVPLILVLVLTAFDSVVFFPQNYFLSTWMNCQGRSLMPRRDVLLMTFL